jgi:hypothetical protein
VVNDEVSAVSYQPAILTSIAGELGASESEGRIADAATRVCNARQSTGLATGKGICESQALEEHHESQHEKWLLHGLPPNGSIGRQYRL